MSGAGPQQARAGGASGAGAGTATAAGQGADGSRPFERTMFSYDPIDEFTATVADWIWFHAQGQPNIEIEAKIGTILDRSTGQRLFMPVMTETILLENTDGIRFVSQVTTPHHSAMNKLLNQLVTYTNAKNYSGTKVNYQRQMETDYFHKVDPSILPPGLLESIPRPKGFEGNTEREDKLRFTRDRDGKPKHNHALIKRRLASLEVFCPKRAYDYRISINTETPVPMPAQDSKPTYWREKNRMTYKHELVQVDLTLVNSTNPMSGSELSHELEIELQDANKLLAAGQEARGDGVSQDWTPYDDMCHIFLNNIRMLLRNIPEGM
ncbi:mRNA-capping enzyme subunit beta [Tilletia horrida]|nr:mRNA-capping enzyme subunit beta [Tilletia horrida]KAK0566133.1 mRNA-capping enzyme subunit beta [Tilletia horrida]